MPLIDTYKTINRIVETGVSQETAEVLTEVINDLENEKGLATKSDVREIKIQLGFIGAGVGALLVEMLTRIF